MKRTTKLLAILLAVLLTATALPFAAVGIKKDYGTCGDGVEWSFNQLNNTMTIRRAQSKTKPVTMSDYSTENPPQWIKLGELDNEIFGSICKLIVDKGVKNVGAYAFENCTALTEVELRDDAVTIGNGAFKDCVNLQKVTAPETLENIGDNAFFNCTALSNFPMPKKLKTIGKNAFYQCWSLPDVTVPGTVDTISDFAFFRCDSIKKLKLEKGVKHIGNSAFAECTSLQNAELSETLQSLGMGSFSNCYSLTKIKISKPVNTIPKSAFAGCFNLTEVEFYNGVHIIEEGAFDQCPITTVKFHGNSEQYQRIRIDSFNEAVELKKENLNNFEFIEDAADEKEPEKKESFLDKVKAFFNKILKFFKDLFASII